MGRRLFQIDWFPYFVFIVTVLPYHGITGIYHIDLCIFAMVMRMLLLLKLHIILRCQVEGYFRSIGSLFCIYSNCTTLPWYNRYLPHTFMHFCHGYVNVASSHHSSLPGY